MLPHKRQALKLTHLDTANLLFVRLLGKHVVEDQLLAPLDDASDNIKRKHA